MIYFQIIIDIAFFITVVLLLFQLNQRMVKRPNVADAASVRQLERVISDCQECTNQFLKAIEEKEASLGKLARQLDIKEKRILILIEVAEALIKKSDAGKTESETVSSMARYEDLLKMMREGLSREEVVKRSGFTEGEIQLVAELSQIRVDKA